MTTQNGKSRAKNGGKRIFPDKKVYSDTQEEAAMRKKVRVVATVRPAIDNRIVSFSWWDVDDPNFTPPHDPYDSPSGASGPDNYGSGAGLSTDMAVTDGSGKARVTFTVTMQPGDNFKMAASTSQAGLAEMTQEKADGFGALPIGVKLSEMLTVWRKLHVEADSMGSVHTTGPERNWVTGVIDESDCSGFDITSIDLNQDLEDCWEETESDHFKKGKFWHEGASSNGYPPFRTISHSGNDEIEVEGHVSPVGQVYYTLQDDDDFDLLPRFPDVTLLYAVFADCYIACAIDARGSSSMVPFKRNLGGSVTTNADIHALVNPHRGSSEDESANWWVVYLLSGYQPAYPHDGDPGSETVHLGHTTDDDCEISVVYLETIHDGEPASGATIERQTVAHEIGHQVLEDNSHVAGSIMQATYPISPSDERFCDEHIKAIRSAVSSPGN